ncbi:MAG TPA: HEAT repeat domain-containing protein, partial [Polyangiaceae bacterium]|nr:HEAT repeat domain-containing protein [Polyangiaceae bacterium]
MTGTMLDYFREALAAGRKPAECQKSLDNLLFQDRPTLTATLELFLDSPDEDWRREACVQISSDIPELVPRVRELLRADPRVRVRAAAASTLGEASTWPDSALLDSVEQDPEEEVRVVAFVASLRSAGVPESIADREFELCLEGKSHPSRAHIEALILSSKTETRQVTRLEFFREALAGGRTLEECGDALQELLYQ